MRDLNARLNESTYIKQLDRRGFALNELISLFNLNNITTLPMFTGAAASYVSYDERHKSLIDRVIISEE